MGALSKLYGRRRDQHVDLEVLLSRVVAEVVRLLEADRGTLYLVDHARGELVSRVAQLPELAEIRLRAGEGVAGWVATNGSPVRVREGSQDSRFASRIDELTGYHTVSLLAAPVKSDSGAVIGVLQVLNKTEGRHFGADDETRLVELSGEVAQLLARTSIRSQLVPDQQQGLSFRFNNIVGESAVMREVFKLIGRAAATDATVLVRGESGSGKEVIARAIHHNSPRREQPFVKVDCAALPAQLIENELFGHERGAFTGADSTTEGKVDLAKGGTLFLDEVAELPIEVQGKLLRLLQEKTFVRVGGRTPIEVDVRFVGASHRDLEARVEDGLLRQDLYYRLCVVQIPLPPLRTRGGADLDRLIDHFVYELCDRHDRPRMKLTSRARGSLHAHHWPGNVRELENCLESAVVLVDGGTIDAEHLRIGRVGPRLEERKEPADPDRFEIGLAPLRKVESEYVKHVVRRHGGNQTAAAKALGIGRNTLLRKLRYNETDSID